MADPHDTETTKTEIERPGDRAHATGSPSSGGLTPFGLGIALTSRPTADEVIAEKMGDKHIDLMLQNLDKADDRASKERMADKIINLVIVAIVVVLVGLLCHWTIIRGQYQIALSIVTGFFGFAGGYGVRAATEKSKPKDKED